jgi:MFS family permease
VTLGRAVHGFGAGLILVSMYVLIARVYPADVQARVFTVLTAAWVLPAMVGPLLSGWITETVGWRWVFIGVVPVVLLAAATLIAAGTSVSRVSNGQADRERDAAAGLDGPDGAAGPEVARGQTVRRVGWALVAALGVVGLTVASDGASGLGRVALTALGAVVVLGAGSRLMPRGVLRGAHGLPSVIAQRALMGAAFAGAEAWIPLMFTTHRGWSLSMAGWFLTPAALTWFGGSWLSSRPRGLPTSVVLLVGPLLLVGGIGFAALGVVDAAPAPLLVLGWTLAGAGMGLTYPVASVLTLQRSEPHEQGVNSAALQLGEALTTALALSVGGVVFVAFAGAAAQVTPGTSGAPASSAGLLACFGLAAALAAFAAVVSRRV